MEFTQVVSRTGTRHLMQGTGPVPSTGIVRAICNFTVDASDPTPAASKDCGFCADEKAKIERNSR